MLSYRVVVFLFGAISILGFYNYSSLLVSMTLNPTTTTTSELHSTTANKLHCWCNSTLQERAKYNLLITGCGYSATGFFSNALTKAGYPIGQERMATYGTSCWQSAGHHTAGTAGPQSHRFSFKHIVLLIRHPLMVLHSWHGTNWNFGRTDRNYGPLYKDTVSQDFDSFYGVKGDFRLLEWWISYTLLGEDMAECYMRTEDIGSDLLLELCSRAELPDCASKDWGLVVNELSRVNSHNRNVNNLTWSQLEKENTTQAERAILDQAKRVCRRFGYENCGSL
jgi:hypothetical protein